MIDVLIIGAGPYALSIGAHTKESGLDYLIVGLPMDFWENKMPSEMFIRTQLEYSNLSDPKNRYSLKQYQKEKDLELGFPLKRTTFVDYGKWFADKAGLEIEKDFVEKLTKNGNVFTATTETGRIILARNVVVAVGLTNSHYIPKELENFSSMFVSHTASHTEYTCFKDKSVIVVGGGQSAWEAAALLHLASANVILCYRRPSRVMAPEGMNQVQHEIASKFYYYPVEEKEKYRKMLEIPTVSNFLVPLVEGKVTQKSSISLEKVEVTNQQKLVVYFSSGETITADHIIVATGYRYHPKKITFLSSFHSKLLLEENGCPQVDESFQSSINGLYFAGPATSYSHGPAFRFIAGVAYTALNIVRSLVKGKEE